MCIICILTIVPVFSCLSVKVNVPTLIMCRLTVLDNEGKIIKVIILVHMNHTAPTDLRVILFFLPKLQNSCGSEVELYQSNIFILLYTGISVYAGCLKKTVNLTQKGPLLFKSLVQ